MSRQSEQILGEQLIAQLQKLLHDAKRIASTTRLSFRPEWSRRVARKTTQRRNLAYIETPTVAPSGCVQRIQAKGLSIDGYSNAGQLWPIHQNTELKVLRGALDFSATSWDICCGSCGALQIPHDSGRNDKVVGAHVQYTIGIQ